LASEPDYQHDTLLAIVAFINTKDYSSTNDRRLSGVRLFFNQQEFNY
jgi:hypothetical protein